jgi:hypothetical protein
MTWTSAVGGGLEPPTVQLATVQILVVNPSRLRGRHYAAFIPYHHPRDRRARLPISTSYSIESFAVAKNIKKTGV